MAKRKSPRRVRQPTDRHADRSGGVDAPKNWEIAVSCAYLRSIGASQKEAARAAGGSERQLREWEHSAWWPKAMEEAHKRWLSGIVCLTKKGLLSALNDAENYAQTARWLGERLITELLPPRQRHAVGGDKDAPSVKVSQGLSEDTIDDIRKKVLGVGDNDE